MRISMRLINALKVLEKTAIHYRFFPYYFHTDDFYGLEHNSVQPIKLARRVDVASITINLPAFSLNFPARVKHVHPNTARKAYEE